MDDHLEVKLLYSRRYKLDEIKQARVEDEEEK